MPSHPPSLPVTHHDLNSSNLRSADYSPSTYTLVIEFNSGARYQYSSVPGWVFDDLCASPSAGRYFAQRIRTAYPCVKL